MIQLIKKQNKKDQSQHNKYEWLKDRCRDKNQRKDHQEDLYLVRIIKNTVIIKICSKKCN